MPRKFKYNLQVKMALSRSVVKAQDFICCNVCETETKIRWKCLTCDLLMCEKCREKIHPKFDTAKNHKIKDIKEVGLYTEQDIDFTNIKCKQHPDQACCIFCSTCDKPVCPSCIAKTHSKHEFLEIKEVYQMKIERLKNGQKKIEDDKAKVKKGSKEMIELQKVQTSIGNNALQEIQDHREVLVKKVDHYIEKLTKKVEQKTKTVQDSFAKEKYQADKIIQTLEEQNKKAEEIVKSKDASKFFDVVDDLVKSMEKATPPMNISNNSTMKFVPGDINLSNVGSIQTETSPNITKIEVVKEFMTEVKIVDSLLSQEEDSLWITDYNNRVLQKVRPEEYTLKTISNYNTQVYDMSVTPSNDILLSTMESTLKWINVNTGKLTDSLYSVKPLITQAVHVTDDFNIITGAMTPGTTFPATGRRVVIVMDKNGEHQMVYEHDRDNKRLFTLSWSITSTRNGNIAVVDKVSENDIGRLVILSDRGGVINIYTGHPEINTKDKPFRPQDIMTTQADNIIATDVGNSLLHILDCDGQVITYINTLDKGIQYPFSLEYTTTGHLYIGCFLPSSHSGKAKLYEVVLSGC